MQPRCMSPGTRPPGPWLPPSLLNTSALVRLFCLPYAGAGASAYRLWTAEVPSSIQICRVQIPGRENRIGEPPFKNAALLVPELIEGIRRFFDRPFVVFGHSMDALLAFEMARSLRQMGLPQPRHLFLSSHPAPPLRSRRDGLDVHLLDRAAFLDELRRMEGTPEEVLAHEELMQIAEPILRADFELCATYVYTAGEPLDIPFSVFGGTNDSQVLEEDLAQRRDHTRWSMLLRMFPGKHR